MNLKHRHLSRKARMCCAIATLSLSSGMASAGVVYVSTSSELTAALANAAAGQTIQMADGIYNGNFIATAVGSAAAPIRLLGSANAVLQSSAGTGYGLYLNNAQYWDVSGFTVSNYLKGIVLDGSSNNTLENLTVDNIDQEGVHFRKSSSNNTIQFSHIFDTGNGPGPSDSGFGEGIYIGSAVSNWATLTGGNPDASNYNRVISNLIGVNVRAEGVDIKEGTIGGLILNNTFDASGISGANSADSVVDVKGSNYTLKGNVVINPAHTAALLDAFQVHVVKDANNVNLANSGTNNTFDANSFNTGNANGYGVNVVGVSSGATGNAVCSTNSLTGPGKGVSNIALSSCAQVDEPSPLALMLLGGLGLGAVRRLRSRR
ncbi:MAG: NosD domain-containing protein [Pseudomonadota bacterium]